MLGSLPGGSALSKRAPPSQDEVAWAQYPLSGESDLEFSGTRNPRWTLNDGR